MRLEKYFTLFTGIFLCVMAIWSYADAQEPKSSTSAIAGAAFIGQDSCAACHEKIALDFKRTSHGKVVVKAAENTGEGCESCHWPGSLHAEEGGDKTKISKEDWERCYKCHSNIKAQFSQQFHHPVPEKRMGCNACHDIHSTTQNAIFTVDNDTCLKCHQEKKGPWVFEHEAVRDGCTTCHNPHGSINTKLLTERDYNLCLKCHYSAERYQSIGHYAHRRALNPSSLGAKFANCTGCHRGVHGSNYSKELRTE